MSLPATCPNCRKPTTGGKFCGSCGADLTSSSEAMDADTRARAPTAPDLSVKQAPTPQRTMFGMPAVQAAPPTAQAPKATPVQPQQPGPPAATPDAAAVRQTQPDPAQQRTMFGMPAVTMPKPGDQPPLSSGQNAIPSSGSAAVPPSGQQDLPQDQRAKAAIDAQSQRTMLGMAAVPVQIGRARHNEVLVPQASDSMSLANMEATVTRRRRGPSPIMIGALGFTILAASAIAFFALRNRVSARASLETAATGDILHLTIVGATPGSKVQVGNRPAVPLADGRARIVLDKPLGIGKQTLSITLEESGKKREIPLDLDIAFRFDWEIDPNDPDFVVLRCQVAPGVQATVGNRQIVVPDPPLAGTRVRLTKDAENHRATGSVAFRVVRGQTEIAKGDARASFGITTLAVLSPRATAQTDETSVRVRGTAAPGANVWIGTVKAPTTDGVFDQLVALQLGENQIRVRAIEAGKVARVTTVALTHVSDVDPLVAARRARNVTYADLEKAVASPTPSATLVASTGTVIHRDVLASGPMLQLLAACSGERRCVVWVDDPGTFEPTVGTRVRAVGTVSGIREFDTERGKARAPAIRAEFVVPAR